MANLTTAYVCGICQKKFYNSIFLVRHIELRHPQSARKILKSSNKTQDKTSGLINQRNLSQEKSNISTLHHDI